MDSEGWCLTESDPQVFTQLLKDLGVKGLQVDDLYSLDETTVEEQKPIHALIFLFKYVGPNERGEEAGVEVDSQESGVWFANQVINNSCGTVAALNAVMNIPKVESPYPDEAIDHGSRLDTLREFGAGMDSQMLGHTIAAEPHIRETHNAFSRSSPFAMDASADPSQEKEDAYHFIAYVPVHGLLYELDGLRGSPIMHAAVDGDAWIETAKEVIEARIATYPPGALMFNLLSIRSAAIPRLRRLMQDPALGVEEKMYLQEQLDREERQLEAGQRDNALRRHNLLPAVFSLLKAMGESGHLDEAIADSRKKGKERRENAERGEAGA